MTTDYQVMARLIEKSVIPANEAHGDAIAIHMLIEGKQFVVTVMQSSGTMITRHAVLSLQAALAWTAKAAGATVGEAREPTPQELKELTKDIN
jgi:hypothetical protein